MLLLEFTKFEHKGNNIRCIRNETHTHTVTNLYYNTSLTVGFPKVKEVVQLQIRNINPV